MQHEKKGEERNEQKNKYNEQSVVPADINDMPSGIDIGRVFILHTADSIGPTHIRAKIDI